MDGQPFYCLANSTSLLLLFSVYPSSIANSEFGFLLTGMNTTPRPLAAIRRDWIQLRAQLQLPDLTQLTRRHIRLILDRMTSLKIRMTRCRLIATRSASRLRARLLRAVFVGWRTLIKRLLRNPVHREDIVAYLHDLLQITSPLNPNSWVTRLVIFDGHFLHQFLPELALQAPLAARMDSCDPFWRAVKGNPSVAHI